MLNSFNPSDGGADIASAVNNICLDFVWLGLACMVASYLEVAAWMTIGAQKLAVCSRTDCETSSLSEVCGRSVHGMTQAHASPTACGSSICVQHFDRRWACANVPAFVALLLQLDCLQCVLHVVPKC